MLCCVALCCVVCTIQVSPGTAALCFFFAFLCPITINNKENGN